MSYQEFKNKWLGKRVDIDGVYGFQCVDLVKQYMLETQKVPNGAYGNAADYWNRTNSAILKKYDKIAGSNAKQGDIVVLKGINGNPYGHIGIADSSAGVLTITILEQNGSTGGGTGLGRDAIRTRAVPRWRVLGLLRPKAPVATQSYLTVQLGEGLSHLAKRAGYNDFWSPARWEAITRLNGTSGWRAYNASLKVGQKVRVK